MKITSFFKLSLFLRKKTCFVNKFSFQCRNQVGAPFFFLLKIPIVGFLLLLSELNVIQVNREWLWPAVLIGIGVACLLEWRYAQHSAKG
jgi:hypothetical protein